MLRALGRARPVTGGFGERRQFFRLPVSIPARYVEVTDDDDVTPPSHTGRLFEISGGGALLISRLGLQLGDRARLSFSFGEEGPPFDLATEVRSVRQQREGGSYRLGLAFVDISRGEQERLIRGINAEQIRQMERGLL
jgi:c-di-GMP-binding flagellar brake protein YcgR